MSFHTWIAENGGRMMENEPSKVYKKLSNTACFLAVSSDYGGGSGRKRTGVVRGKCGSSNGAGLA
ncbi:unnamed protein product [Prunus armeniaca]